MLTFTKSVQYQHYRIQAKTGWNLNILHLYGICDLGIKTPQTQSYTNIGYSPGVTAYMYIQTRCTLSPDDNTKLEWDPRSAHMNIVDRQNRYNMSEFP